MYKKISTIIKEKPYKTTGTTFFFIEIAENFSDRVDLIDRIKAVLKKVPRFYEAIIFLTSTMYFYGLSAQAALTKAFESDVKNKTIINLGSGPSDFGNGVINVDSFPYDTVHIVANAEALPILDNSVDMVLSESMLEHIPYPELAISEIARIIKPGGFLYIEIPFMFPYHGSPSDYTRFTISALRKRFDSFEVIGSGTRSGPITALVVQLMYALSILLSFGSQRLYSFHLSFTMIILSPLKILDFLMLPFPYSVDAANHIYFFARKK
ncbi:class I SAM-dependent methyltransferase [Candidatus Parcubacteria bacterium]|nr:class I SAM-dependent methyltransferase [Candidatus Parcubacteria bacterium]